MKTEPHFALLGEFPRPSDWQDRARCKDVDDPDIFFPSRGESVAAARRLCERCPVKQECLDLAVTMQIDYGLWGGVTPGARRALWTEPELAEVYAFPAPKKALTYLRIMQLAAGAL